MTIALYVLLGLSVFMDLALGAWASAAWGSFAHTWNLAATTTARLLGLVLGLALFFFAALQILAFRWIRAEKEEGHHLVIGFGFYLMISSLITFLVLRRVEFLLIDGLRGALLAVFSVVVLRSPLTVRELRLPDTSSRLQSGARRGRDADHGRGDRRHLGRSGAVATARFERNRPAGRSAGNGRRERRSRQDHEAEERHPRRTRERLRPLVTSATDSGESTSRSVEAEPRHHGRASVSREGDRKFERRIEHRTRSAEELVGREPVQRSRPAEPTERPLTVVVKGGPEGLLRSRSSEEATGHLANAASDENASGSEERRRRRRRRPRGQPAGSDPAPAVLTGEPAPSFENAEERRDEAEEMEVLTAEPRSEGPAHAGRKRGRGRRSRRSHQQGRGRDVAETGSGEDVDSGERSKRAEVDSEEIETSRPQPVEALDMLSLLEPPRQRPQSEPFGRSYRPVVHHHQSHRSSEIEPGSGPEADNAPSGASRRNAGPAEQEPWNAEPPPVSQPRRDARGEQGGPGSTGTSPRHDGTDPARWVLSGDESQPRDEEDR